ncbi:restriction endonuclease subunit S [Vibrio campbellii]|uniref:Restriction endonuclease subunit S n=1 Tax=Vibrio campbellii TaxID=680 RepID=A0AAQ2Y9Y0_9VIBR|nr:restriction endonuclease subunit S [Vibrio campbellii]WDG11362.1 restriction endonuclease subunit S [Vibrio campbellii]
MVPNGWEEKSLKDICKKTISYGIVQTGENIENGVPCVRVVDLSKNTLNPVEMIKTSDEIHQSYKKTTLCEGELMMALRGEIGLVKKVTPELVGANITRGLARLSPIKSVDSDYLLWTLRSNKIKNELSRKSGGSALQEIALGSLRKVVLPIPPLPEQRKIAQILSTWDKAISTTEKLIDASKQQKKALMQQLLTGKKRLVDPETGKAFEGEWENTHLSNIASIKKGKALSAKNLVAGSYPVIAGGKSSPYSHVDFTHENVITVSASGAYAGYVSYHPYKIWASDCSVVTAKPANYLGFIFQWLQLNQIRIYSMQSGGAQPHIYPKDLEVMKLRVPKIEEQQKIASVLTAADKEIELLEAKLAYFKQEKKALMQQLLTGKRRVKVAETEAA